jgi:putative phosphoribosyl transferase
MILFKDRYEAGTKLAELLKKYKASKKQEVLVLGIPRGGVPVGFPIAQKLNARFDVFVTRKIPIPFNPEAGFGAVTPDGTMYLNKPLVTDLGFSESEIKKLTQPVLQEIKRRLKKYRDAFPEPEIKNKIVILVDDGLASGYTMLAAIKSIKKQKPSKIIVAVPVAPRGSVDLIKKEVDDVICCYIEERITPFAVASFYQDFRDLSDKEVITYLKLAKKTNEVMAGKQGLKAFALGLMGLR